MKKWPLNYDEKELELYDQIPKHVWATIAKDLLVKEFGEDRHAKFPHEWTNKLLKLIALLKDNKLIDWGNW